MTPQITWAETFKQARGELTQSEAGRVLCGCSVRTVQDWELGRREPPEWVKGLIIGQLLRHSMKISAKKRKKPLPG